MKYPVRMSSQVMMNAMVDANSNYPSAAEIAQALNEGERMRQCLIKIQGVDQNFENPVSDSLFRKFVGVTIKNALREGAGES